MTIDLYELLDGNLVLLTFTVIGLGFLLGRLKIGKFQVGPTTGVLLVGILFGHLGFSEQSAVATFGFTLFIFSVGLQAGPRFFSAFLEDGPKYIVLSLIVAGTAFGLAFVLSKAFGLEGGLNAGMLAGAMTSTPTLAGASDAIKSGLANLPEGVTPDKASANVGVGYAITYVFGTVGLIVFVRLFPGLFKIDLPAEARKLAKERGLDTKKSKKKRAEEMPILRAYAVSEEYFGHSIAEIVATSEKTFKILRVRRGRELLEATNDLELKKGDVISVIATLADHKDRDESLGDEVLDAELLNYHITSREIVIDNAQVVGRHLDDLETVSRYGCFVTGAMRSSVTVPADGNLILNKGDRLQVTGEEERLRELALELGHIEEEIEKTDLLTFSLGIAAGVLLGLVMVKVGAISIGIGSAGGLLLVGIILGFLRSVHPTFGGVPAAARFVMMEMGLMLFMAAVGVQAGEGIAEALANVGPVLVFCGIVITLTPVVVGFIFGHKVLKLNPALLLGSLTGAMTSTPALDIVNDAAKSSVPALGYAGTYTFANVLLTFAGTLIMTL